MKHETFEDRQRKAAEGFYRRKRPPRRRPICASRGRPYPEFAASDHGPVRTCTSCGDRYRENSEARARFHRETGHVPKFDLCLECFCEKKFGAVPRVTDSSFKPAGTGLVERQRIGKSRTDS
jgi:hypothetical protein